MKRFALGVLIFACLAWAKNYYVHPGDTLWSISRDFSVDLKILLIINQLNDQSIYPGQKLLLPEKYIVKKGDTLWNIVKRFNTSIEKIKLINNIEYNNININQELWIVSGAGEEVSEKAAVLAQAYIGYPYQYGEDGPMAFDCSGYVQYIYKQLNINLPRTAADQWAQLPATKAPEPGDLVFFSFSNNFIDHVGIYLGNNKFIHVNSYKKIVLIEDLNLPWYKKVYRGAKHATFSLFNK